MLFFPFGFDSVFNLMQPCHVNKLGGGGGWGVTGPKTRVSFRGRSLLEIFSFALKKKTALLRRVQFLEI